MPTYVYGCDSHPDQRKEVIHRISESPIVLCEICLNGGVSSPMHRIPQAFRWYMNPALVLYDKLDEGFQDYKRRKGKRRVEN
jgi:hypothetical protein